MRNTIEPLCFAANNILLAHKGNHALVGKLKIASLSCQRVILPKIIMKNKLDVDTNDKTSIELGYSKIL